MLFRIILITFSFMLAQNATAFNLSGEGYAPTREEAKKKAIAALSEALQVEVKSETDYMNGTETGVQASRRVQTLSELPLLGVDFSFFNKGNGEQVCTGMLDSVKAGRLYTEKLSLISTSINSMHKHLKSSSNTARYQLLGDMLAKHDQFGKYQLVARLLGVKQIPAVAMTVSQIKGEMLTIEAAVPNLDLAAKLLTRDLPDEHLYVYAAMPQGSREATELSRLIRDKIMSRVKTYENPKQASQVLKGHYEVHKNSISVTYRLVNDFGETEATRVVKLAKSAYKNIGYKTKTVDFNQLLHNGYVVSNKFHAELNTNRGKNDLLFTKGEEVEIFARVNRAGYFYIVAHNTTDKSSYVMDLSDAQGNRKFVKYVNADQANRWISLGSFEVVPPYGVENLQLIASNKDLLKFVPNTKYDRGNELYMMVDKTVKDSVVKTRGLKRKKAKKDKALTSEATLTITTMQ